MIEQLDRRQRRTHGRRDARGGAGRLARGLRALGVVVLLWSVGGCELVGRPPGVHTGPDGLRTFTVARGVLCTLGAAANPLTGTLDGDATDAERLWLVDSNGERISIVWPEGFRVQFEPIAVLYDERSRPVARAGQQIRFGQVNIGDHAGTPRDPYWATGLIFDGCYPPALLGGQDERSMIPDGTFLPVVP